MKYAVINKLTIYLFVLVFIFPSVTHGTDYYMRADGTAASGSSPSAPGPCDTAANCLNVANHNASTFLPGDRINLCDDGGYFTEQIVVPSSGEEGSPISYTKAPGSDPKIVGPEDKYVGIFRANEKDWITVDGLDISGGRWALLLFKQCDHTVWINNTLHDGRVSAWSGNNATISYNTWHSIEHQKALKVGNQDGLVNTGATDLTTVSHNTFYACNDAIFDTEYYGGNLGDREIFNTSGNYEDNEHSVKNVIFEYNLIRDGGAEAVGQAIVVYNSEDVIVRYNEVYNYGCPGMDVDNSDNVQVYGNIIHDNDLVDSCNKRAGFVSVKSSDQSSWCPSCDTAINDIYIYNNTFANNDTEEARSSANRVAAFHVFAQSGHTADNINIKNNISYENWHSSVYGWEIYTVGAGTITNLTFDYNYYRRTTNTSYFAGFGLPVPDSDNTYYAFSEFATYQSTESQDANSSTADPLLASSNGIPTRTSPCVGAGADLGDDYDYRLDSRSVWPDSVSLIGQSGLFNIGAWAINAGSLSGCRITGGTIQ